MMAQSRAESTRDTYNYGQYINQFPLNMIKVIREFERIQKKYVDIKCLLCLMKFALTKKCCLYIYIYVCVCVYVCMCAFQLFDLCVFQASLPCSRMDIATALKKSCFILSDWSDTVETMTIAFDTLARCMWTSLSVDEMLLPRYMNY